MIATLPEWQTMELQENSYLQSTVFSETFYCVLPVNGPALVLSLLPNSDP